MRVPCHVVEVLIECDEKEVDGICVTCTRCEHSVTVFGTSGRSVRRGLARLRDECPEGEDNFYVNEEDEQ